MARFNSMYEEYVKYPTITRQRMFYETMEEVMPGMKIIIQGENGAQIQQILPLDVFSGAASSGLAGNGSSGQGNAAGAGGDSSRNSTTAGSSGNSTQGTNATEEE